MMITASILLIPIVSFFATFFLQKYLTKKQLLANVNERSSHTTPIPTSGGIVFISIFFIALTVLNIDKEYFSFALSLYTALPIFLISAIDDFSPISAKKRLAVQIISAVFAIYMFNYFSDKTVQITDIIWIPIIVWMTNLYNFIDGIDGYAATGALFGSLILSAFFPGFLILTLAIAGFMPLNFKNAKIFMGDSGSATIGFIFGISFYALWKEHVYDIEFLFLLSMLPFILDTTYTLTRRAINKENILKPHKTHIFQKLSQKYNSHILVTTWLLYYEVTIIACFAIFLFSKIYQLC